MTLYLKDSSLVMDGNTILQAIDFELCPGRVVAVIGANGAGKSSMLKLLSGEVVPSSGEAGLDGRLLAGIPGPELARRLGVLPQHSMLDFPFRAREVVAMGRIPHFTGRLANQRLVEEVMARLQLQTLAERVYTTLSGGERQRVQIARVLCQLWDCLDASMFLFDEPTAPLDLAHQLSFLGVARELADRGAGVMLVMHDVNLASRCADVVAVMRGGRIIAMGPSVDVVNADNIRAAFDVEATVLRAEDGARLVYTRAPL